METLESLEKKLLRRISKIQNVDYDLDFRNDTGLSLLLKPTTTSEQLYARDLRRWAIRARDLLTRVKGDGEKAQIILSGLISNVNRDNTIVENRRFLIVAIDILQQNVRRFRWTDDQVNYTTTDGIWI